MKQQIFDCVMFAREYETLLLRFMEYYDYVDYFIITEARKTHRNKEREPQFYNHIDLFQPYMDKVVYILLDDLPFSPNDVWVSENYQRGCFSQGIDPRANPGDIVIISDIDEFWDTNCLDMILNTKDILIFNQILHYYYYNLRSNTRLIATGAAPWGLYPPTEQRWRARYGQGNIIDAGWHYSAVGGPERLKIKHIEGSEYGNVENEPLPDFEELYRTRTLCWPNSQILSFIDINKEIDQPKMLPKLVEKFPYLIGQD